MKFGKAMIPLILCSTLAVSSYGNETKNMNDTMPQNKKQVQIGKEEIHTILSMVEIKLGGCAPRFILATLKGKNFDGLQFPGTTKELLDFLYIHGIALDQGGCFALIDTVVQSDISARKKMLDLMYGENRHPSGDTLKPITYIVNLQENLMGFKARTTEINGIRKIHIDKGYWDRLDDKLNNSFVANELLHYRVNMDGFDIDKAMHESWSEQLKITYDTIRGHQGEIENYAEVLTSMKKLFEQYASTALCLQDIGSKEERENIIDGIEDAMIKNFSGIRLNDYLLEGSLMVQILGKQFPEKMQYQSEESFVQYAMQKVQEQDDFKQLHDDIMSIDMTIIKKVFAEEFLAVKDYGMKFTK